MNWPPRPRSAPTLNLPPAKEKPVAQVPPPKAEQHEANRIRAAAHQASHVLPPAVAKMVARELTAHEQHRYLPRDSIVAKVADEILAMVAARRDAVPG